MNKYAIALGMFDSVHLGHKKIIDSMLAIAKKENLKPSLITFSDDFFPSLGLNTKHVFLLKERIDILHSIGEFDVFTIENCKEMFELTPEAFMQYLSSLGIVHIIIGDDFTFGKDRLGNACNINDYSKPLGIAVEIVKEVSIHNLRISSTMIRQLLATGDILQANKLLYTKYFIEGIVIAGRGQGRLYSMPTINIVPSNSKALPKIGVYKTFTYIDNIKYLSITNVGTQPTFLDNTLKVETRILNFSGDVYGKTVKVEFEYFIRDIIKFETKDQLYNQINQDIARITND